MVSAHRVIGPRLDVGGILTFSYASWSRAARSVQSEESTASVSFVPLRWWSRLVAFMDNQPDREDDAPLAKPDQDDVPVEPQVEPVVASREILSTRTSRAWIRLLPALVVLVIILVFVFQNPKDVTVSLFTFSGTLPLSVALLGAVVLGALMTLALGSVRIYQLRRQVHSRSER